MRKKSRAKTLRQTRPDLVHYLVDEEDADYVSVGSAEKVYMWCKNTETSPHFYHTAISTFLITKGCGLCSGRVARIGYTTMWDTHPEIAVHLLRPEEAWNFVAQTNVELEFQCNKGHTYKARGSTLCSGQGCGQCAMVGTSKIEIALSLLLTGKEDSHFRELENPRGGRWSFDFCLDDGTLGEYYGDGKHGGHTRPNQITRDHEKVSQALAKGYKVFILRDPKVSALDIDHQNLVQFEIGWTLNEKKLRKSLEYMVDFDDEASGKTETANGFIAWRFFNHDEDAK